jgi:hypothetical protein
MLAANPHATARLDKLGYKKAKWIIRVEAVASSNNIGASEGGYWQG